MRPNIFGDDHPLTPYSVDTKVWVGWQFNRPDLGEGMVQMFRRPDSTNESMQIKLRGLELQATYTLTNTDNADASSMTGRELLNLGMRITIKERPGSALIAYKKNNS